MALSGLVLVDVWYIISGVTPPLLYICTKYPKKGHSSGKPEYGLPEKRVNHTNHSCSTETFSALAMTIAVKTRGSAPRSISLIVLIGTPQASDNSLIVMLRSFRVSLTLLSTKSPHKWILCRIEIFIDEERKRGDEDGRF